VPRSRFPLPIESSPVREQETFVNVYQMELGSTSVIPVRSVFASALVPLARYLRWKVTGLGGGTFSVTFRAWIVARRRGYAAQQFALAPPGIAEDVEETNDCDDDLDSQADERELRPGKAAGGPEKACGCAEAKPLTMPASGHSAAMPHETGLGIGLVGLSGPR
jgi:hypothetical protein